VAVVIRGAAQMCAAGLAATVDPVQSWRPVMTSAEPNPRIVLLSGAADATELLLEELRRTVQAHTRPLVCFATGNTFTAMLERLADAIVFGRLDGREFTATHLDEYLGFPPTRPGGMVHELVTHCPPLGEMLRASTFLPVPCDGSQGALVSHDVDLDRLGGVKLQLLGIGRNGHLAFNEPGTPFSSGFHMTELAETTRDDARSRFAPDEPPRVAATSGLATILRAERLVLCAFGSNKAEAVRQMLEGPIDPACPASLIRKHRNVTVYLDHAAAALTSLVPAAVT
jgi:glucosamine-6-phosphate deaminase